MADSLARSDGDPGRDSLAVVLGALTELPRSADPAEVLAELARLCVPICSDNCAISTGRAGHRLRWPPTESDLGGPVGIDPGRLQVRSGEYSMTWTYRRRRPTDADLLLAQLALDRAVAILEVEQLRVRVEAADELAANLQLALASSREIGMAMGIVMDRYKLSPDQAFELLGRISQRRQRRVREVAAQIAETGAVE